MANDEVMDLLGEKIALVSLKKLVWLADNERIEINWTRW